MKKRIITVVSLVFVLCCLFALTVSAAECGGGCVDSWAVTTGEGGYLGPIEATDTCPNCGEVIGTETIEAMFVTTGYSYNEVSGGIIQHFAINKSAISRYTEITGNSVQYGAVITTGDTAAQLGSYLIDQEGKATGEGVYAADIGRTGSVVFDVMINNIPKDARSTSALVCGAYIVVGNEVSYIDDGAIKEKAVARTFNEIAKVQKTLRVLTIGNSFSDDSMEYVYSIAKAAGVDYVELGNVRRNSGSLANHIKDFDSTTKNYAYRHWADGASGWDHNWDNNATLKSVLESGVEWDYVVFQQVSTDSGNASTYDDLNTLMELVRPYCPNAKFAWLMTWSFRADYASQGPSYAQIASAVQEKIVTNENIDVIIPCGTAIENAKETGEFTNIQLQRDAKHLNYGMGRYIAGLTFFKALTGLSIDGMSYPTADTEGHSVTSGTTNQKESFKFTDALNETCIECANNAIEAPFAVTELK